MNTITADDIRTFLKKLGERYPHSGKLYILGGSAICLLGNPRPTVDLDYAADFSSSDVRLREAMVAVAKEMALDLEDVTFQEFIPLPDGADRRHRRMGKFGELEVYVFDPYSIALSKVARGFETDLEDVVFLLRRKLVTFKELEAMVQATLPQAQAFDINPQEFRQNWEALRKLARR
jgi:hypothetical protein